MRKILSEKEKEKKKQKTTLIISIFMLGVLVLGTVGYGFLASSDIGSEEGIEEGIVRNVGNQWVLTINGQNLIFTNSPESVKNISVPIMLTSTNYVGAPLYVASENPAVVNEIGSTLGRYSSHFQEACYGPCEKDLPEKDCTENLIVWRDSLENKVFQEENCIFIDGDLSAVDAFLYKIFGI